MTSHNMQRRRHHDHAFGLLVLIFVLSILAIIASMVMTHLPHEPHSLYPTERTVTCP